MLNYTSYMRCPHHRNKKVRANFMHFATATIIPDTEATITYLKTGYPHDNTEQKGVTIKVVM